MMVEHAKPFNVIRCYVILPLSMIMGLHRIYCGTFRGRHVIFCGSTRLNLLAYQLDLINPKTSAAILTFLPETSVNARQALADSYEFSRDTSTKNFSGHGFGTLVRQRFRRVPVLLMSL